MTHTTETSLLRRRSTGERSVRRFVAIFGLEINQHSAEIDEHPYVSSGVLTGYGKDQVRLRVRVEHGFLAAKIPHRKFRLGYFRHASDGNRIDAEDGFCRHLHGVEEGLVRMSKPFMPRNLISNRFLAGTVQTTTSFTFSPAVRLTTAPV